MAVQRFMALHKPYFPIKSRQLIRPSQLEFVGLVDAQRRDRFGTCAQWLDMEQVQEVQVWDHHVDQTSDIVGAEVHMHIENVGSVTTLIVERLQQAGVGVTDKEATLFALGIHADTGSLVYECTTPRDAAALSFCLQHGASQKAIMQVGLTPVPPLRAKNAPAGVMNVVCTDWTRCAVCSEFGHIRLITFSLGVAVLARAHVDGPAGRTQSRDAAAAQARVRGHHSHVGTRRMRPVPPRHPLRCHDGVGHEGPHPVAVHGRLTSSSKHCIEWIQQVPYSDPTPSEGGSDAESVKACS